MKFPLWVGFPALALVGGSIYGWLTPYSDDLTILDVGQGDCAVFRHGGATILIDDGPLLRSPRSETAVVTAALRRRGIGAVDLILLSHPDADHVGGTGALLEEFPGAKVAISAAYATQPKLLKSLDLWHLPPESLYWLPSRASIQLKGCSLRIECPPVTNREDDNRGSMFVRIDDDGATADFSGDAPADVEAQEVNSGNWVADILHAGHHGSRRSTSAEWIRAVHPSLAVISCGRDNAYGHPHQATLDRLSAAKVPIARTDLEGDLVFVPQGGHFRRVR